MAQDGEIRRHPNGGTYIRQNGQWVLQSAPQSAPGAIQLAGPDPEKALDIEAKRLGLTRDELAIIKARQDISNPPVDRRGTAANVAFDNEAAFRKEFNARPEVQNYQTILPLFASAVRAGPGGAGDVNIIYALAKAMDPGSVVREGELQIASTTGSAGEQLKGYFKQLSEGGTLTKPVRDGLLREMRNRASTAADAYNQTRQQFSGMAQQYGIDPAHIVGPHPGAPFQQAEADFLGRPVRNLDGSQGSAPMGGVDRSSRLPGGGGETESVTLMRKGQSFATENDKRLHTLIQTMLDNGATVEEANATAEGLGYKPQGNRPIFDAQEWAAAQRYNATVRDGQPRATVTTPETGVSNPTLLNQIAGSDAGAFGGAYVNGITGGFLDEGVGAVDSLINGRPLDEAIAEANLKKGLSAANSPKANILGNVAGGLTGALTGGAILGRVAPAASQALRAGGVVSPGAIGLDLGYGALFGAGEENEDRLGGAAKGAALAAPAGMLGRVAGKGLAAASRTAPGQKLGDTTRRIFRLDPTIVPPKPGAAERMTLGALNKAGMDDVSAQLREADALGIPMTLADTHPELRSLAGASVRRSPTASLHAENTLIPRSRGQINRLGQYVERDLGPTANLVEASKGLSAKAKQDARPLYEAAFSSPGASSVNVNGMLQTPAGQSALRRAYDVMRNRQMDPTALGFDLNDAGEVVLNRVPSFEALDIVKRELDDAISSAPFDPVTRQQTFSPAQRDAIKLRNELVGEMDRVNPDYKAARAAYAGPASEREALRMGKQSVNQNPDVVSSNFGGLTPPRQEQFKLGYRSGMMENAERVRLAGNPFEATLGSPAQQETVGALFPQGAPNLLRSYDIERNLANTTNDILGNSKTAQRVLADQEFGVGDLASTALDVGVNIATGQVPTGLVLKQGAGQAIKDWWKLGVGNRARQKAEELAPILLDTDPLKNIDTLTRITADVEAFNRFLADQQRRISRPVGMLGSVGAAQNNPF